MKKLIKKVVALAMAAMPFAASAAFTPVDGQQYLIKKAGAELYLQITEATGKTTAASVSSTIKNHFVFEQGTDTNAGKYAIKCVDNNKYLTGASGWNAAVSETPLYYSVTENASGNVQFARPSDSKVLALDAVADGEGVWTDKASTNDNSWWTIETYNADLMTSFDIIYKLDGQQLSTQNVEAEIGSTFTIPVPAFYALAEGQASSVDIAATTSSIEVNVVENLPFVVSESFADATWHIVHMHPGNMNAKGIWVYAGADENVDVVEQPSATLSGIEITDEKLWAFVGNMTDGFTIYNRAAGEDYSLYADGTANTSYGKVGTSSERNVWKIYPNADHTAGRACFKTTGTPYLNMQGGKLRFWSDADNGSTCWFETVEDENLPDRYSALRTAVNALDGHTIGTGLAQYNNAAGNLAELLAAAQALIDNANATDAEIAAAAASLAADAWTINQPEEGVLYRLKRPNAEMFASSIESGNRIAMVDHRGAETLWMIKNGQLVAWNSGKLLGKFSSTGDKDSWGAYLPNDEKVSPEVKFGKGQAVGTYTIYPSTDRYIYNAFAQVDCGGTNGGPGYDWEIEEVASLDYIPVPVPTDIEVGDFFTIVSPVALSATDYAAGRVGDIYTLNEVGGIVRKTASTTIPANTSVMVEYKAGLENASVFLKVDNAAAVASNLSYSPIAIESDGTQLVCNKEGVFVRSAAGSWINGFTPYYVHSDSEVTTLPVMNETNATEYAEEPVIAATESTFKLTIKGVKLHDKGHDLKLVIRQKQSGHSVAARRAPAVTPVNNEATFKHENFEQDGDDVVATMTQKLEEGTYELDMPEGFFQIDENTVTPHVVKTLAIGGDGFTTSLEELSTINYQPSTIYDLQGRKLSAPVKGINIIGGRKILKK